jgi:hypothetical protein
VLPERTSLHVVDEANCVEVHVRFPLALDDHGFSDIRRIGGIW